METISASELLAALGHESRLAIFRMLVEAGEAGLNASAIGQTLSLPPATLSFHLAHLSRVGLIKGRPSSRFIFYAADYRVMDELIAFLTSNCCQGASCLPKAAESFTDPAPTGKTASARSAKPNTQSAQSKVKS